MRSKTVITELIEREKAHLAKQEAGSDEYNKSVYRLIDLNKELENIENSEVSAKQKEEELAERKKDQRTKNIIEGVKVGSGIALPLIGYVVVVAFEKDDSFTSALKGVVNCFIPKKL